MAEMIKNTMGDGLNKLSVPNGSPHDTSPDVVKQAKDVASNVAGQAKDLASQVATQAKDLVASQVTHQQEKSAGDIKDVANALRQTSHQLEGNVVSPYVERAADGLEQVSQYLRTANFNEVKTTVESFARREPLLFLGGAFVLGILGARFLKSSSHPSDVSSRPQGMMPQGTMRSGSVGGHSAYSGSTLGPSGVGDFRRPTTTVPGGMGRP